MKKREHQLPKIELTKRRGSIEWSVGLFFLLFLVILLCAQIQISAYQATSLYLEDALAASNLASAVIDVKEYGISHIVRIENPAEAYTRYVMAVKNNLQLNDNWECENRKLISSRVNIEKYIIYNVTNAKIQIFHVSNDGHIDTEQGVLGNVKAPNGTVIEKTSIYSEISFQVQGFLGNAVQAHKGNLVDIVADSGGLER